VTPVVSQVRATITHTVSARFVEIDEPIVAEFERSGVLIRINASVRESHSFATVVCSGRAEIVGLADKPADGDDCPPFLSRDGGLARPDDVRPAWFTIEPILRQVGAVLRWRFGMFGDDPLWTSTAIVIEVDGHPIELTPIPQAAMGDDRVKLGADGLCHVADLVGLSAAQPLAHEMWREAWNLRHASPRSGLVVGIAAAEVGLKQLIALLAPSAASLVEHLPSPPLDTLIRRVLPSLPTRSALDPANLCPQHLRKRLIEAVEARNLVVHQGAMPQLDLRSTLLDIRDFLYLLDWHAGHAWAEALLSQRTRDTCARRQHGQ
jgi:hypothetical protein